MVGISDGDRDGDESGVESNDDRKSRGLDGSALDGVSSKEGFKLEQAIGRPLELQ